MRIVFGLVLLLGIGLAGFAVFMTQNYINSSQAELARERALKAKMVPTVEVYVVNRKIEFGEYLTKEDVQKIAWPQNALPETIFSDEAVLFPAENDRPRIVVRAMEKFEPLLASKVTEPGEDAGLTSRLKDGMRAFAIKVDVASGVSGFLRPDDRVDIYWTGNTGAGSGDLTRLIEASVTIIAVDQTADTDRSASATIARTITVEASPQQVARLAQAQATGRLALSLVGNGDQTNAETVEIDSNRLLGIQEREVVQVEEKQVCTVKTRKAGEVIDMPIPCAN
ncbi:MAG: Flp pilus assembly protein CpaB [Paracoccaceae bacterium]